jgi:hypothetical protein
MRAALLVTVTDESGAVMTRATVTARRASHRAKRYSAVTDRKGTALIPLDEPGVYDISGAYETPDAFLPARMRRLEVRPGCTTEITLPLRFISRGEICIF